MGAQAFHEALDTIWNVVRAANGYIDRQAPWKLAKEDPERMGTVLYALTETIRHLGIALLPFIPAAAGAILDQVGVADDARDFDHFGADHATSPGTAIDKPKPVFPKIVEEEAPA